MIANNSSSYSGYHEVIRVEKSVGQSENNARIGKLKTGWAYTQFHKLIMYG